MKTKIIALSLLLSAGTIAFSSQAPEPADDSTTPAAPSSDPDTSNDYPFDPPMLMPHIILSTIHPNI